MVAADGRFEPEVMDILGELLPADGVALDVGANIGVLTLPLARFCREGKVFAFEPGAEAVHYLRRNIEANGFDNVAVEETAVMDVTGEVTLDVNAVGSAWSFVSGNEYGAVTERVRSVRLDDWLAAHPEITRIDVVKMDIESSELKAMAGAARLLDRFRPALIVEYNPLIFEMVQGAPATALSDAVNGYSRYVYALLPSLHSVRVTSQRHLDRICGQYGLINLLATRNPLPARHGHFRSRLGGLVHLAYLWRCHNRWRRPRISWFATTDVAVSAPAEMRAARGASVEVPVAIQNRSRLWMSSEYDLVPVYCGFRWFRDGRPYGDPVLPRDLTKDHVTAVGSIPPRGRGGVRCRVKMPAEAGTYELRIGVVQERFVWIDEAKPASGARVRFEVT